MTSLHQHVAKLIRARIASAQELHDYHSRRAAEATELVGLLVQLADIIEAGKPIDAAALIDIACPPVRAFSLKDWPDERDVIRGLLADAEQGPA